MKRRLKKHEHLRKREYQKGYTENVESRRISRVKETQTREFRKGKFNYTNSYLKLRHLQLFSHLCIPFSLAQCHCPGPRSGIL